MTRATPPRTLHLRRRRRVPGDQPPQGPAGRRRPRGRAGLLVARRQEDRGGHDHRTLLVFDRSGENRRALLQTPGNYCFQPAWSPDGEWIAFASDRDGNSELYKVREDGTDLTRLTHTSGCGLPAEMVA